MIKRVFLFLITNFAIIIILSIIIMLLDKLFWINISWFFWWDYLGLFIFAIIFGFWWSFISLFISKYLAKSAYNIKIINPKDYDQLDSKQKVVYDLIIELSEKYKIKTPEIGFYISPEPNAFATGATKNSSLVAVSSWLLQIMDKDAIEWVIWHEMAHILNWDMVTMTLLQWVMNTFVIFFARIAASIVEWFIGNKEENSSWSSWTYYIIVLIFEIILWILASLVVMSFSRHREFAADKWSWEFVWKNKMIKWLEILKNYQNITSWDNSKLATLKISTKSKKWFLNIFSSHPQIEDRIDALNRNK